MIIKTKRKRKNWPSWDLIYEWEDVFASKLDISLCDFTIAELLFNKTIQIIGINPLAYDLKNKYFYYYFELTAQLRSGIYNRQNFIPFIIDFYVYRNEINRFYKAYFHCPFILISSLEAYNFLEENNFSKKIYHLPLSISDKYKITEHSNFEKKYDLVMCGRQNSVLKEYVKKYSEKHHDFIYVYRNLENGIFNYYTSTKQCLGNIDSRKMYLDLISQSKVVIYSTPGIDGGEKRTNGFNQVTPRFLESIACGCHIIARYKENPDTEFYELEKFSPNINTYEEFEQAMNKAFTTPVNMKMYADYLEKHYTSKRVELLNSILEKEGIKID
jgi:hypothetical protein